MWKGWDAVVAGLPENFDPTLPSDALETSISQHFAQDIRRQMTGFEPYDVMHSPHEFMTRLEGSHKAPIYDIGFILNANRRVIWPVEAKVLATDGAVSEYIRDINEQFLTCRYAPLSRSGAMAGYLLSGSPVTALANIESKLGCPLAQYASFLERNHRVSTHARSGANCAAVGPRFTCHHLMLSLRPVPKVPTSDSSSQP